MVYILAVSIAVVLLTTQGSYGKHFRGGSMSWKPLGTNQIQLRYQVGFTKTIGPNDGDPCTPEAKANRDVLQTSGNIECDMCSEDDSSKPMNWICDDFDSDQDSTVGHYTVVYDIPQPKFDISYESCCWIDLESPVDRSGGSKGWNMLTHVDVTPRPDGRINSSPVSASIPVEKFYHGCQYLLRIPASDPDNDVVRCRYADSSRGECPGELNTRACGPDTDGLSIGAKSCFMTFDTSNISPGHHAVNVIIEDFARPFNRKTSKPLSKVSLLFLLEVGGESTTCAKPDIIDAPMCMTVRPNERLDMVIRADPGDPSNPIDKIRTQKPGGMTSSAMMDDPATPNRKMVTLSWTPTEADIGEHPVCYSALDADRYTSGVECTFIYVDNDPLRPVSDTSKPAQNQIINTGETWVVQFNREILPPRKSAFINILDPDTLDVVFSTDVSTDPDVVYGERSIEFTPPSGNLTRGAASIDIPYILQLGEVVAKSVRGGCGSVADQWRILVHNNKMVTQGPPIVTRPYEPPPTFECQDDSMDIDVPSNVEEGEKCFVHMPATVTVSGGVISAPYKLCCHTTCAGAPGTFAERPGTL